MRNASASLQLGSCFLVIAGAMAQTVSAPLLPSTHVTGEITNFDGSPAAGYLVEVVGASKTSTARARLRTNVSGDFEIFGLKYGEYVIAPYQEAPESRYPGGTSSFYDPSPTRIDIDEHSPNAVVHLHLGMPNRIASGEVRSAYDNKLLTATIQIEVRNDPDRFVRFSSTQKGMFRVLVPANTPLILRASAPSYKDFYQLLGPFDGSTDPQITIRLEPKR